MAVATQEAGTNGKGTSTADASAYLQQESRRFASLYEANAYVAYNLALRITGEPRAAKAATERGFLMRLGQEDSVSELALAVVTAARGEARDRPDAGGAGDEEADRLLAAIASLPIAERVAVALNSVGHGTQTKVGAALDLPSEQAGELRKRAQKNFASALGTTQAEAKTKTANWPWTQPPPEIWEPLYMQAYRALERGLMTNGAGGAPVAVAEGAQQATSMPMPTPRRTPRQLLADVARAIFVERSFRNLLAGRPRWMRRAATAGAILLPAAVAALIVFGGGKSEPPALNLNGAGAGIGGGGGQQGATPGGYKPLTPQELDKLRLNELKQLKAYSQQQQNKSLSFDQRRNAAERAARLAEKARARLAAQQRRAALLRQQRKVHHHHRAVTPPPPPPPSRPTHHSSSGGGGGGSTQKQNTSNCLYDEHSGSYLCPTG